MGKGDEEDEGEKALNLSQGNRCDSLLDEQLTVVISPPPHHLITSSPHHLITSPPHQPTAYRLSPIAYRLSPITHHC